MRDENSSSISLAHHFHFMKLAIEEAKKAILIGEVPIAALIIDQNSIDQNSMTTTTFVPPIHNCRELSPYDPCGHAEILAMRAGGKIRGNWRLSGLTLYVTVEPCPMCLAAMIQARIDQVIFGAYDAKGGALSLGYNLHQDRRLNHKLSVVGGVLEEECGELMKIFFKKLRES